VPERDVRVSPDHAIYLDGLLFEARGLINGLTIYQETQTDLVTYHHVELAAHDVILAEGLAAESYLDTGNRTMFEATGAPLVLHPDFAPRGAPHFCAPLIRSGARLDAVRTRIALRARTKLSARG